MKKLIKLLLNYQLKSYPLIQKTNGFTLIELLIGLVMAILILTPLLGFLINIMQSDQREQAKVTTDQEIQTALDYIARDVQQAVYIYDSVALNNTSTSTPPGIKNQIPPIAPGSAGCSVASDCVPVLVFWKRKILSNIVRIPLTANCTPTATNPKPCDDTFVYSLVAYYLIKDSTCNNTTTWSCAARIGRFEIKDRAINPNDPVNTNGTPKAITNYDLSDGFKLFDFDQVGSLEEKMNAWRKSTTPYTAKTEILIDYIDQTKPTSDISNAALRPPTPICPSGFRPNTVPPNSVPLWRKSPDDTTVPAALQTSSFYACVNSTQTTAQVFIRGNALARINPKTSPPKYSKTQATYFPIASVVVRGRGFLNGQ